MLGYGVPNDVVVWDPTAPQNLTSILYAPDGSAHYAAYVM
jgi:hypothetical protein